ncbi:protein of unknown function [Hyphomicrobium sp. MC1]|nr:protein of unknown function [Hyphomicrobium sp. MC1]
MEAAPIKDAFVISDSRPPSKARNADGWNKLGRSAGLFGSGTPWNGCAPNLRPIDGVLASTPHAFHSKVEINDNGL